MSKKTFLMEHVHSCDRFCIVKLTECGYKNLDRDGDGVPCEALCD